MTASAQRAAEPSMEEILASIRRIIADDKSRTRIGSAKLVSVSEPPVEKTIAEEPALEPALVAAEPAASPVAEAQTFGEGREAFSVESASRETAQRVEAETSALPASARVAEESAPARNSPSLRLFGTGTKPLGPLSPDARALSMPSSDQASRRVEAREVPSSANQSLPEDVADLPPVASSEIEAADEWDADEALSRAFSPERELARETPDPGPAPELASPSPRLAQACAGEREAARLSALAGSRLQSGRQDAAAILSSEADRAVTRAFGDLNRGALSENVRSLEDVVKEMLRPLLKTWLDDNLPRIVERLVRMEIERVARGRPE
jgi:uncharacterized protein